MCVPSYAFDWQVSQQGHAGVRKVSGVCDVTGERPTYSRTERHRNVVTGEQSLSAPVCSNYCFKIARKQLRSEIMM